MFHYAFLVAWEPSWRVLIVAMCCTLFTNCCTGLLKAKRVAHCSQTVCRLLHIEEKRNLPSRPLLAISLSSERANAGSAVLSRCTFPALSGEGGLYILAPANLCHELPLAFPYKLRALNAQEEIMVNLMTEQEVSKRLNVSVASLRRWRLLARGPAFLKVGSLVRYRSEDLESWLAELPTGGSASAKRAALRTVDAAS
jgi:hypothetical protein